MTLASFPGFPNFLTCRIKGTVSVSRGSFQLLHQSLDALQGWPFSQHSADGHHRDGRTSPSRGEAPDPTQANSDPQLDWGNRDATSEPRHPPEVPLRVKAHVSGNGGVRTGHHSSGAVVWENRTERAERSESQVGNEYEEFLIALQMSQLEKPPQEDRSGERLSGQTKLKTQGLLAAAQQSSPACHSQR